jgi:hypothetical protein
MKSKVFCFVMAIVLLLFSNLSFPQSFGLNFTLGFPMNEFKQNVKRTGFGGSLQFLLWNPTPELPYTFGLNLGYINYGSESRTEPFSYSIPDVSVDVSRTNNIINFHFLSQVIYPYGNIRPYMEFLLGGSYIFTMTQIDSYGSEESTSTTNFDDWAWSYGAGAGFLIKLTSDSIKAENLGAIFLDFKVRYLYGTEAQYLKEGSVTISNGQAFYDVSKSKTDLLTAQLGVIVYLDFAKIGDSF